MERDTIGAILRKAIKERGFTQEEFAEKCNISYPALKRYMSGDNAYSYELLEKFAEVLDCSYDYLLGKSRSFKQEYHEVTEQTRLSEEAIANICKRAMYFDEDFVARYYIRVLDSLLKKETAFASICDFMLASKYMNNLESRLLGIAEDALKKNPTIQKLDIEDSKKISMETMQMINLVVEMKTLKEELTQEFIEELKKLGMENALDELSIKLGL